MECTAWQTVAFAISAFALACACSPGIAAPESPAVPSPEPYSESKPPEADRVTPAPQEPPPLSCGEVEVEALLGAVPAERRRGLMLDDEHARFGIAVAELDGVGPGEAILAIDSLVSELEAELGDPVTALFVFRCEPPRWRLLDRMDLPIDRGWDGTIEGPPGVVTLRAEPFDGVDHEFVRVEHVDIRGSYDPRFVARRFLLLHVVGDEVVVAFDRVVRVETESGPARAPGDATVRTVLYRDGVPPRITLRVRVTDANGRSRTRCRTDLTFDGRTFVPADSDCD